MLAHAKVGRGSVNTTSINLPLKAGLESKPN